MANVDNPRGFSVLRGSNGGEPRMRKYKANVTTDIFRGDIVQMLAAGTVKTITTTTGAATVLGVAANAVDASDSSTSQEVWVYDDPDQEFEVQDDGAAATPSAGDVGATYALILTTGNTTTGLSKHEVDASGSGAAATDAVILMGFKEGPLLSIGKNASMIVKLNRHIWKTSSAGI
jgi:ketosteroid isomerase-like protein